MLRRTWRIIGRRWTVCLLPAICGAANRWWSGRSGKAVNVLVPLTNI